MIDLYAVLGVSRDADIATIRRAFRKKVRNSHPDGGGSVESFNALKSAYDILSDPVRRRRYDETGEVGDPTGDPHLAKVIEILSFGLDQALLRLNASGAWKDADVIPFTAKILAETEEKTKEQKIALEAIAKQAQRLKGRFQVTEGENLMETVIEKRMAACQQQVDLLTDRLQLIEEALAVLGKTHLEPLIQLVDGKTSLHEPMDYPDALKLLDLSPLVRFS
jgi:curved DNA-binding protein CbpA